MEHSFMTRRLHAGIVLTRWRRSITAKHHMDMLAITQFFLLIMTGWIMGCILIIKTKL